MKSAVETLNPTRVKLTVEVSYDELKPSLDAAYKSIAGSVNVPGFRRGHVPARIIDQRVGKGAVLEEAVNNALPRFYGQAVEENQVRPLGQPTVDVTDIPDPAEGGELKFTAEVDVRPTVELPDYDSLAVTVDDVEVTDEDVDGELTALRQRFGTLVGAERPAAQGDFVSIDLAADIDGEEIDSVKGVSYEIGSATMIEGLDESLIGRSAGESADFDAPLAGGDRAGETSHIHVTVNSVKERELPELDDEFAQLASEFDTLDELRADLRTKTERTKLMEQGIQARDKLLDALLEASDVPVPGGADRGRGALPPGERGPARGPRARRRGRRERSQGPADPVHPGRDRREGAGLGRPARADRVPRHERRAVRHGAERVRQGGRGGRPGARRWSARSPAARRWPWCWRRRPSPTRPAGRSTWRRSTRPARGGRHRAGPVGDRGLRDRRAEGVEDVEVTRSDDPPRTEAQSTEADQPAVRRGRNRLPLANTGRNGDGAAQVRR